MKKVIIISNESGGGHRQTAKVLSRVLEEHDWTVKVVSVFKELFADLDLSLKLFGISSEEIYNQQILRKEASQLFYRLFFFSIYYLYLIPNRKILIKRFARFFAAEQPDLVISVIPIINSEMAASLHEQSIPFLIIQTDLFEYEEKSWIWRWLVPHGSWFTLDEQTYLVAGTEKGYQQALAYQSNQNKVFKLSGNLIDSRFLSQLTLNIEAEREKLGLNPNKPIGLFLYGGYPPNRVFNLAKKLDSMALAVQFIFICGNNQALKQRLNELPTHYEKLVVGYTTDVPYYMHLAHFLIGKSGPGVIMESLAVNLPLLLDVQHVILHEADNALWVEQQQFGLTFKTVTQLHKRIKQLTWPDNYQQFKANVTGFDNQAVFEIPKLIESIL